MEDFEQWVARVLAEGDEEVAAMLLEKGSDRRYRAVEVRGAFAAWENRQHKINVLQRGVKELTARLSDARNGTPCSEVRAAQAEKERDEYSDLWRQERTRADALAAHTERMEKPAIEVCEWLHAAIAAYIWDPDQRQAAEECEGEVRAVVTEGPAASLARFKLQGRAESLRETAALIGAGASEGEIADWLDKEIIDVDKQAKGEG